MFLTTVLVVYLSGSASALGPYAAACRTYPTLQTSTISSSSPAGQGYTITQTCSAYDQAMNEMTCTWNFAYSSGDKISQVHVFGYTSLRDFVDEMLVIPPVQRLARQTSTSTGITQLTTFSYDSQSRLTRSVLDSRPGGTFTTTYGGWDSSGRFMAASASPPTPPATIAYSYNDAARTMTWTSAAGTATSTFDANGNLSRNVATFNGITTTTVVRITSTAQVCR